MKKKMYIGIGVILITLMIGTTCIPAQEIIHKNICSNNMDNFRTKLMEFLESDTFKETKKHYDALFNESNLAILNKYSTTFVTQYLPLNDPLADGFVQLIMLLYEIMAIFIGHNEVTIGLCMMLSSIIVVPTVFLACFISNFIIMFGVAISIVAEWIPQDLNLYNIAYKYGIIGVMLWILLALPILIGFFSFIYLAGFLTGFPLLFIDTLLSIYQQAYGEMHK